MDREGPLSVLAVPTGQYTCSLRKSYSRLVKRKVYSRNIMADAIPVSQSDLQHMGVLGRVLYADHHQFDTLEDCLVVLYLVGVLSAISVSVCTIGIKSMYRCCLDVFARNVRFIGYQVP